MSSKMQTPRAQSSCMLRILQGISAVWLNHRPDSNENLCGQDTNISTFLKFHSITQSEARIEKQGIVGPPWQQYISLKLSPG